LTQWVDSYKARFGCFVCGEKDHVVLDLHHKDPTTKESSVGLLVAKRAPLIVVMAEAAKCVVVCANCHRRLHYKERLRKARRPPLLLLTGKVRNTLVAEDDDL